MDLTLSDEQRLLAETARAFVARECPTARVRAIEMSPGGDDLELWRAMAGLGWAGLLVPAEYGGAGRGLGDLAVVCEEVGRAAAPVPLVASAVLATLPVLWAGSESQRRRWLRALAAGDCVGTLAVTEPGMRDPWATPTMGHPPLRGTKLLVPFATAAGLVVVATAAGFVAVDPEQSGHACRRHDHLGGEPLYEITFDGTDAEPLGSAGEGASLLARVVDHAAIAALAYAVGLAQRALELAVQHARDREQFGRPIGAFQAVAHRCVDMRTDIDACRVLAHQAAWALDREGPADREVAAALVYAHDAIRRVFLNAHQVHGAIGFSTEHDLHLYTRRAKAFELAYGARARQRDRLAAAIGLR
ncbi:MAG: acyl-CoA dehydrogenase family protein [Actinomycetota bacterium]